MRVGVIILAAGAGRRMGAKVPKAFLPLAGRPLFLHCLAAFRAMGDRVLVVPRGQAGLVVRRYEKELIREGIGKVAEGGGRRQDSVERGLAVLDPACDVVLVHDAARPFVTAALARAVARQAARRGAAVPGLPARDTIKQVRGGRVAGTLDRSRLIAVQTPQGIRASWLREAYARGLGRRDATDDVQLVERLGRGVAWVPGDPANFKITSREDLGVAEYLFTRRRGR
jgi:2-C-methyl-D-erythritol 4-phosphate cytidylyltransferase